MDLALKSTWYWILTVGLLTPSNSAIVQVLVDLDDNSEDLIGSLISRVERIVGPAGNDTSNVSLSLAHALLKLAPTLSITGNVSDGANTISLTFSFSATTTPQIDSESDSSSREVGGRGGVLEPVVQAIEPWVLFILEVAAHSILGVIVTQILQATALLENVPFS